MTTQEIYTLSNETTENQFNNLFNLLSKEEENKDYRLIGLPLYNAAISNIMKQSIYENLEIEL